MEKEHNVTYPYLNATNLICKISNGHTLFAMSIQWNNLINI